MRCKMSMVHEFELGMISMVDLKHKVRQSWSSPYGGTKPVNFLLTGHRTDPPCPTTFSRNFSRVDPFDTTRALR